MLCNTWKFILCSDGWFGDNCSRAGEAAYHRATSNAQDSARPSHDRREHPFLSTYKLDAGGIYDREVKASEAYICYEKRRKCIQCMYRMYIINYELRLLTEVLWLSLHWAFFSASCFCWRLKQKSSICPTKLSGFQQQDPSPKALHMLSLYSVCKESTQKSNLSAIMHSIWFNLSTLEVDIWGAQCKPIVVWITIFCHA